SRNGPDYVGGVGGCQGEGGDLLFWRGGVLGLTPTPTRPRRGGGGSKGEGERKKAEGKGAGTWGGRGVGERGGCEALTFPLLRNRPLLSRSEARERKFLRCRTAPTPALRACGGVDNLRPQFLWGVRAGRPGDGLAWCLWST